MPVDDDAPGPVKVFFLSDSTGISAETMGNALLLQFPGLTFERTLIPFITTVAEAREVVATLAGSNGAGSPSTAAMRSRASLLSTRSLPVSCNTFRKSSSSARAVASALCASSDQNSTGGSTSAGLVTGFAGSSTVISATVRAPAWRRRTTARCPSASRIAMSASARTSAAFGAAPATSCAQNSSGRRMPSTIGASTKRFRSSGSVAHPPAPTCGSSDCTSRSPGSTAPGASIEILRSARAAAIRGSVGQFAAAFGRCMWRMVQRRCAVFLTAAFTGLRMGELIALRWGDVDFDTEALHVYGSYSLGTLTAPSPD